MAAVGHVGGRAALEVAVAKTSELLQKRNAQTYFEVASKPKRRHRNGKLEQKQRANKNHQRTDRSEALIREAEVTTKVEQASKQHDFDQNPERRDKQSGCKRRRRKQAVGPQEA
jgi:hypothetical protein